MRLDDDGATLTLDLHGLPVDEAVRVARRTVRLAASRGRATERLVHGASTSSSLYRNRTIKHALHDALAHGDLAPATGGLRTDAVLILALPVPSSSNPAPIRLSDVR